MTTNHTLSAVVSIAALCLYLVAWSGSPVYGQRFDMCIPNRDSGIGSPASAPNSAATSCSADTGSDSCSDDPMGKIETQTVKYGDETYRLDEAPAKDSQLIAGRKLNGILGYTNISSLIEYFGRLGSLINLAYNGAVAAGPKFTEVKIEIQDIGHDITDLFDESSDTLSDFETTSQRVLIDLMSTYDYLINNLEKLAFETLLSISEIAKTMKESAQQLKEKAEKLQNRLKDYCNKITREESKQELTVTEKAKERKLFEQEKKEQNEHMDEALKNQTQAAKNWKEFELQEIKAISSTKDKDVFTRIINLLTTISLGFKLFDEDSQTGPAEYWKKKKEEAQNIETEQTKQYADALEKMKKIVMKMSNLEEEENMAKLAKEALHETVSALKGIIVVTKSISVFWQLVEEHCNFSRIPELIKQIESAINNYSKEERLKVWTSPTFKKQWVFLYADWVEVGELGNHLVEHIKLTRAELYNMLEANPTYEESLKYIKDRLAT